MKALASPPTVVRLVGMCLLNLKPLPGSFPDGWDGCR